VGYQRQDFGFNLNGVTSSGATRPIQDVFHYFGGGISVMLPVRNRNEGNIAAAMAGVRAAERRVEFTVLSAQQEVAAAVGRSVSLAAEEPHMERDDAEVVEEGSGGRTRHRLRRGLLQGLVGVGLIVVGLAAGLAWSGRRSGRNDATERAGDNPSAASRSMPAMPGMPAKAAAPGEETVEVSLTPEAIERAGIKTAVVGTRAAVSGITVPATVTSNAYRDTKVNSLVGGVVRQVSA